MNQHPLANQHHHQQHYAPPTHYTTASSAIVQPHHHHQYNFDFASPMYAHHHQQQSPAHIPAAVTPVTNTSSKDTKQQKPKRKQVKNACGRLCHMNAFRALLIVSDSCSHKFPTQI